MVMCNLGSLATGYVGTTLGLIRIAFLAIATIWLSGPIPDGRASERGVASYAVRSAASDTATFRQAPVRNPKFAQFGADLADDPDDDDGCSAQPHTATVRPERISRSSAAAWARLHQSTRAHLATGPPTTA